MRSPKGCLAAVGFAITVCLLAVPAASAASFAFATGDATITGLGDEIGSGFDKLQILGTSGSISYGTNTFTQSIGTLTFTVGGNCYACTLTPSGALPFTFTVDGSTRSLSLPWSWSSIGSADTIEFGAITPSPLAFTLANGDALAVSFLTLRSPLTSGGPALTESLDASFTIASDINIEPALRVVPIPEPDTYAMLFAGLGLMGFVAYRRKRTVV